MASAIPLSGQIEIVREETYLFGTTIPFRNGDSTDPYDANNPTISITRQINRGVTDLLRTGFAVSIVPITLVGGVGTYAISLTVRRVLSVYLNGVRLIKTTLAGRDLTQPAWRNLAPGTPNRYAIAGNTLYVIPGPSANGTLNMVCEVTVADLSLLNATIDYLPHAYHELPAIAASIMIANMDASNEQAQKRKPLLLERYNDGFNDLASVIAERNKDDYIGMSLKEQGIPVSALLTQRFGASTAIEKA